MIGKDWRIFISYRGQTEGEDFARRLYKYLIGNPSHENMYGGVFFSLITSKPGDNYDIGIPDIMRQVEFFVMPLTDAYFADFWDEENNCPDKHSIIYKEIQAAIAVNSKFICVGFPGFTVDEALLNKLFGEDANRISCSILLDYDLKHEEELMRQIGDAMVRRDYNVRGMADFLKDTVPNVWMSFKRDTENGEKFPFYQQLHDVKRITLLNYASSSFITGIDTASIYQECDYLKRWFIYNLGNGNIEANIILTDPHSSAAQDAALYKMYPVGLNVGKDNIISHNLNQLFHFMENNPSAKLHIYLTHIALPYGIIMTEHIDSANNYMKVDLYSAVTNDDGKRPSFFLQQDKRETAELYSFFEDNVRFIMNTHAYAFNGHPRFSWLLDKHIIHRGMIRSGFQPHTKSAFEACLEAKYPVEVDLLALRDGTIIVGRDDHDIAQYGFEGVLSGLTVSDLRNLNRKAGPDKMLTFQEFLDLIGGRIPLLIEIKTGDGVLDQQCEKYVSRIASMLRQYSMRCLSVFCSDPSYDQYDQCVAVHSSNPYVLRLIKDQNCMIPCGIISADFSYLGDQVSKEFCKMHETAAFMDILTPDFISYRVENLWNNTARTICEQQHIPLLGWTIKDEETQNTAKDYCCNNIIIEGAKTYK